VFFHTTPPVQLESAPPSQTSSPNFAGHAGALAPLVPLVVAANTMTLPPAVCASMEFDPAVYAVLAVHPGSAVASEVSTMLRLMRPTSARSSTP